jgi:hypothetical protein
MTRAAGARRFDVALSTVKTDLSQREAGATAPTGRRGPVPRIGRNDFAAVRAQVRPTPDATLAEHAAAGEEAHHVRVSRWTMGRVSRGFHVTRKKALTTFW